MTTADDYRSGKGSGDENFPVASALVSKRHRAPILAFYRFARAADDVADHEALPANRKLALLDGLEATLLGHSDHDPAALPLRAALADRGLSAVHALDLLAAFRLDATKQRYRDWDDLMSYCRYSASPVGRFVLDVHGESDACWPANDALCTALQVINHLQDCAKDYRTLDRVYLPQDVLLAHGVTVADLAAGTSSPGLRKVIHLLAARTAALLPAAAELPREVRDLRLGMETSVIVALARKLVVRLQEGDPLSDEVHLAKPAMLATAAAASIAFLCRRLCATPSRHVVPGDAR